MKCVSCGTDNKLKDRKLSGRCRRCNHRFAFEPTAMQGHPVFTDRFFEKAIADISANNTLFFTPEQFHYFFDRRLKNKPSFSVLGCLASYFFVGLFLRIIVVTLSEGAVGLVGLCTFWFIFHFLSSSFLLNTSKSPSAGNRAKRSSMLSLQLIGGVVALLGITLFFTRGAQGIFWLVAVVGLATLILGIIQQRQLTGRTQTFLVSSEQVYGWLRAWTSANSPIGRLLLPAQQAPSAQARVAQFKVESEIAKYSFDRVVICQSDRIAQLLIANNFHTENSCAILSVSGYPQSIFNTTLQMLRRNPALQVFVFHDCNSSGIALIHHLRTNPQWFPNEGIKIVDIGLSPSQILAAAGDVFIQNSEAAAAATESLEPAVRQSLPSEALRWLAAGNFVELESFTSKKLIQVLQRGIAKSQQNLNEEDRLMLNDDSGGMSSLYIVDSFG